MLLLSYGATQIVNFLTGYAPGLWGLDLLALAAHDLFLTYTLPFVLAFLAVTGLYRFVPRRQPQWREAMIGALSFSLLWIAAKLLFVAYSAYATRTSPACRFLDFYWQAYPFVARMATGTRREPPHA
jgi:membrane protein